MVPTLAPALRQIRGDIAAVLSPDTLRSVREQVGHTWRERILDPVTTIHLFVPPILHPNTAAAHLPRLTGRDFSASAYCQARTRPPLALLARLLDTLVSAGFLLDPRRLTVAVSRAKRKMILVAGRTVFELFSPDEETFANAQLWKNLLADTCTAKLWEGTRDGVPVTVWGGG